MKVQITLRGRKYTLQTDEEEDLHEIAAYVDRKFDEVSQQASRLDDYTLAILAALNIASEYERFRKRAMADLRAVDEGVASAELVLRSLAADHES